MAQVTIEQALQIAVQHHQTGRLAEAEGIYRQILAHEPNHPNVFNLLGVLAGQRGQYDEAISLISRAIALSPSDAAFYGNLGEAYRYQGKLEEAAAAFRHGIELNSDYAQAYNNLGAVHAMAGRLKEAIANYDCAIRLQPNNPNFHSNRIYTLQYDPTYDAAAILREHLEWNRRHAQPLGLNILPHPNDRIIRRRLRIGYLSPDFRDHVVGRNILPLLREHDHEQFEIYCYANVLQPDKLTEEFKRYSDAWRDIAASSDMQVTEQIRNDRIDILVDLALHLAGNRLAVFARKPGPVQATFAGYPGTTGLAAMDYRLTDAYLDPPGYSDADYSEKSIRLAHSFWCYDRAAMTAGMTNLPEAGPLPARSKGYVTLGCLNNFLKVNDNALCLWAKVMHAVKNSQLLLLTQEGSHRQRTLDFLREKGIEPDRVAFSSMRSRAEYMKLYERIDIGLDTLPYNGHTTSLDSFWMGVPVVTLVGRTVVGRAGFSQLSNLGLAELAANTPEEYVRIVGALAGDLERLEILRAGLRGRMEQSPLMDAKGFARDIEAAYRMMWQQWCSRSA